MSLKNLKLPFDIHCGGKDLMFPHHTNECAQAAALGYGVTANYWLHNEFVNVENAAKMSKSLNNCVTLSSLEVSGPIIRLALLRTHYKDPLNWSENTILDSSVIYNKWRRVLGNYLIANNLRWPIKKKGFVFPEVLEILSKNLNTPLAISYLDNKIEKLKNSDFSFYLDLIESFDLLGIIFNMSYINDAAVKEMVEARDRHKREKNYMAADKIRETLKSEGILLQDGPNCTLWYKYE